MPTTTFACNKDARIADNGSSLGAGASDFNPVGLYSGFLYRTLLGFSYSFSGMVSITSATLHLRTSTQYYVAFGSDPDINVRRLSSSWSEGTSVSMSGSNAVEWTGQPGVTGSTATADISTAESTWDTVNITTIMQEALAANQFYGLRLYAVDEGAASDVTEFYSREQGSSDPYIEVTYTTNVAPSAPTLTAPTSGSLVSSDPTLAFTHVDSDGDALLKYDLQIANDAGFTSLFYSGTNLTAGISGNNVSTATSLIPGMGIFTAGNTYYWRVATYSSAGVLTVSPWSASRTFVINRPPTVTFSQPSASDALIEMYKAAGSGTNPRMVVRWNFSDPDGGSQASYRVIVQTDALGAFYDTNTQNGTDNYIVVPADPTRGDYYRVEVIVTDAMGATATTGVRRCKAQWSVTEYKLDTGAVVSGWSTSAASTGGTNKAVVTEYGASADGTGPAAWYSSLGGAGLNRWFHWRVWLFAWSGATTPQMDKMTLTYTNASGVPPDGWSVDSSMALDPDTRVYGTQSLRMSVIDANYKVATQTVAVERNTNYILSGRIKSDGNSQAHIKAVVGGNQYFAGSASSTQGWIRYNTPVFNSGDNDTLYVQTVVGGPSAVVGAKAWFDALKLEASTVVTPWTPGFVGKGVTMDAGGIMVDASPAGGATFRLQGSGGGARDRVELGINGLKFGGDIQLYSPSAGRITVKDNEPNNAEFGVGDDTVFFDADVLDFVGLKSVSTPANGGLYFGVNKDTGLYRRVAGALKAIGNLEASGAIIADSYLQTVGGNIYSNTTGTGGGIYLGYHGAWNTGIYGASSGVLSLYSGNKITSYGEGWTAVTFTNSFTNYGSTYAPAAYRKDAMGYVHLRGLIVGGTMGSAAFNLPAGYRPGYTNIYAGRSSVVSASTYTQTDLDKNMGRVDVGTSGDVVPHSTLCNPGYISLEGIVFLAEN